MSDAPLDSLTQQHGAMTAGVGVASFDPRTQIEMTGADRASFLHNLCTNAIRNLAPGTGCEAFLTDVRGHILAHVLVFCGPESLVLETVPGQGEKIIAHLDRYLIREKVELHDRSAQWSELLVAGSQAAGLLAAHATGEIPTQRSAHVETRLFDQTASVRNVEITGPNSFLISGERAAVEAIRVGLIAAGAMPCDAVAVEAVRIEAGWPWFGQDIGEKNLPQELARDAKAISFIKGCYLGQETVARIDALGHVNKTLVGVHFAGQEVPTVGTSLTHNGESVGTVTSAAYSPRLGAALALAFVKRGKNTPGTTLESALGPTTVVALPL